MSMATIDLTKDLLADYERLCAENRRLSRAIQELESDGASNARLLSDLEGCRVRERQLADALRDLKSECDAALVEERQRGEAEKSRLLRELDAALKEQKALRSRFQGEPPIQERLESAIKRAQEAESQVVLLYARKPRVDPQETETPGDPDPPPDGIEAYQRKIEELKDEISVLNQQLRAEIEARLFGSGG